MAQENLSWGEFRKIKTVAINMLKNFDYRWKEKILPEGLKAKIFIVLCINLIIIAFFITFCGFNIKIILMGPIQL